MNEDISSNHRKDVATMIASVPKISYAVTHYDSHRLLANVQFYDIENIMQ